MRLGRRATSKAPVASNTVVVLGLLQGGQAALFAGQIAQSYAPELFLAGVVAIGPVTSLTELAPAVPDADTDPDAGFAAMALYAWSATYGNLPLARCSPNGRQPSHSLIASSCAGAVGAALDSTPTRFLFRPGWSTDPAVRADDAVNEPGRAPIFAPVMVVQGTDDSLVPYRTHHQPGRRLRSAVPNTTRSPTCPIPGPSHSGACWRAGRSSSTGSRRGWPTGPRSTACPGVRDRLGGQVAAGRERVRRRGSGARRTPNPPRRPPHRPPPPGCRCRPPPTRRATSGR